MTIPSARTSAKSRTRRSNRFAIRGVPRERRAIFGAGVNFEIDAQNSGRTHQNLLQLFGFVEIHVSGEPEAVA